MALVIGSYNFSIRPTAASIADANFSLALVTSNPVVTFDAGGDALIYDRAGDQFAFYVAGVAKHLIGDGKVLTSGYLRVGSLSAPNNTTAGDITGVRLSLGNRTLGSTNGALVDIQGTLTDTAAGSTPVMLVNPSLSPASNSSSDFRTLYYSATISPGAGVTMNAIQGGYFELRNRSDAAITTLVGLSVRPLVVDSASPATVGVPTNVYGLDVYHHVRPSGTSSVAVTNAVGLRFGNARLGSGYSATTVRDIYIQGQSLSVVTNYIAIDIEAPTVAPVTLNIGIRNAAKLVQSGAAEFSGNVGFYGTAAAAKPTVTGSRGGNAALASLLTALAGLGLLTDSSTA